MVPYSQVNTPSIGAGQLQTTCKRHSRARGATPGPGRQQEKCKVCQGQPHNRADIPPCPWPGLHTLQGYCQLGTVCRPGPSLSEHQVITKQLHEAGTSCYRHIQALRSPAPGCLQTKGVQGRMSGNIGGRGDMQVAWIMDTHIAMMQKARRIKTYKL